MRCRPPPSLLIALWSTMFTEFWKRKNSMLNLWWGTIGYHQVTEETLESR